MTVKSVVIITAKLKEGMFNSLQFKEYQEGAKMNSGKYGARLLNQYIVDVNVGQGLCPNVVLLVEFPSKEQAIMAYKSDEYKSLISVEMQFMMRLRF